MHVNHFQSLAEIEYFFNTIVSLNFFVTRCSYWCFIFSKRQLTAYVDYLRNVWTKTLTLIPRSWRTCAPFCVWTPPLPPGLLHPSPATQVTPGPQALKLRWAHFWSHSYFPTTYSFGKSRTEIKSELIQVLLSWCLIFYFNTVICKCRCIYT